MSEATLNQLKVIAYDTLAQIEQLQLRLRQVNQEIMANQEIAKKSQNNEQKE